MIIIMRGLPTAAPSPPQVMIIIIDNGIIYSLEVPYALVKVFLLKASVILS